MYTLIIIKEVFGYEAQIPLLILIFCFQAIINLGAIPSILFFILDFDFGYGFTYYYEFMFRVFNKFMLVCILGIIAIIGITQDARQFWNYLNNHKVFYIMLKILMICYHSCFYAFFQIYN